MSPLTSPLVRFGLACGFCVAWLSAEPAQAAPNETASQPALPTENLTIRTRDGKSHRFQIEVAKTGDEQIIGLMLRKSVQDDGGMLFDWPTPRESQMWMKNTLVPLDMVFIDQTGTITHIVENTVPQSLAIIDSHGLVRATLELAGGTTARLGIVVGDHVTARQFDEHGATAR